jgi:carbon-monoxide dehydrogenase iron sulfur subunit
MAKTLYIDYQKCTGCRLCELVCAVFHDGISNPSRSRIKVMKWEAEGLYIPMSGCTLHERLPGKGHLP